MGEHPIEGLMITAMNSIQDMVDVNTIIGDPIETNSSTVIIPISKVCFGFAAGGSEFKGETIDEYTKKEKEEMIQYKLPFGGGSGAGVSISPVAFLVVQDNNVKLLPVTHSSAIDKLLDYVPELLEKMNETMNKREVIKTTIKSEEENPKKKSDMNARQRKQKRKVEKTNTTYKFNYDDAKDDPEIDEETLEYMNEDLDD